MSPPTNKIQHTIIDNWAIQSMRLRKKFLILTDVDLAYKEGNEEALLKRLEEKLGRNRAELILIMRDEETGRL